jgi:Mitochondrial small ribosomal subunit Rsm22
MKVPETLSTAFGKEFEQLIANFSVEHQLIPNAEDLQSHRFLARSVVPHINKLSSLFNRDQKSQESSLDPYWKESSNPAHLRLAYFLYFMPSNLFRVASIWAELERLGFRWQAKNFRAIEFGAGPASGACGIAAGERYSPVGLPSQGSWALIEQDQAILNLGSQWAETYFKSLGIADWSLKNFHRKIDLKRGFLPKTAPKFNLWLMSYYLNELSVSPQELAQQLLKSWTHHLEDEALIILVEPALKLQSRKLLELRKEILSLLQKKKEAGIQLLLPCLGHQICGALQNPEDWCHEEVTWWRPPYFKIIDEMASLDRKTLPFSYLVFIKSKRNREEILPRIASPSPQDRYRLVSPAHSEGRDLEFFLCGQDGKRRARYRPPSDEDQLQRGDILLETEIRGDAQASRVVRGKGI